MNPGLRDTVSSLAAHVEALEARSELLSRVGRRAWYVGLVVFALSVVVALPNFAGSRLITYYAVVPAPLNEFLLREGAAIREISMRSASNGPYAGMGLMLLGFIIGHIAIQRLIRSAPLRVLAYLATPFWLLYPVNSIEGGQARAPTVSAVRDGIVVDRAGRPPARADGTSKPPVPPYHLRPETLSPLLAEQAHYVLAQQAYLDKDPQRVAAELRGVGKVWRPGAGHERRRMALLAHWASVHNHDVGLFAQSLMRSRAHVALRGIATSLCFLAEFCCARADWRSRIRDSAES